MAKNTESKALNESFDKNTNPDIQANLDNLKWLWIDLELFAKFEQRIKKIIWENPWSEEVVSSKLQETWLSVENLFSSYNREFRSILDSAAANDDFFWDEDQLAA